jgi:hypothetical protein
MCIESSFESWNTACRGHVRAAGHNFPVLDFILSGAPVNSKTYAAYEAWCSALGKGGTNILSIKQAANSAIILGTHIVESNQTE